MDKVLKYIRSTILVLAVGYAVYFCAVFGFGMAQYFISGEYAAGQKAKIEREAEYKRLLKK